MPATLGPELNPESTLANEPAPVHNPIALPKKILGGEWGLYVLSHSGRAKLPDQLTLLFHCGYYGHH